MVLGGDPSPEGVSIELRQTKNDLKKIIINKISGEEKRNKLSREPFYRMADKSRDDIRFRIVR